MNDRPWRRKRNGHPSFRYAKPVRLYSWRQRVADNLSAWVYALTCAASIIVVLMDVFVWRP